MRKLCGFWLWRSHKCNNNSISVNCDEFASESNHSLSIRPRTRIYNFVNKKFARKIKRTCVFLHYTVTYNQKTKIVIDNKKASCFNLCTSCAQRNFWKIQEDSNLISTLCDRVPDLAKITCLNTWNLVQSIMLLFFFLSRRNEYVNF